MGSGLVMQMRKMMAGGPFPNSLETCYLFACLLFYLSAFEHRNISMS